MKLEEIRRRATAGDYAPASAPPFFRQTSAVALRTFTHQLPKAPRTIRDQCDSLGQILVDVAGWPDTHDGVIWRQDRNRRPGQGEYLVSLDGVEYPIKKTAPGVFEIPWPP